VFVTRERRLCDFIAITIHVLLQSTQLLPGYVLFNNATHSDTVISVDYTYSVERRDCWWMINAEICNNKQLLLNSVPLLQWFCARTETNHNSTPFRTLCVLRTVWYYYIHLLSLKYQKFLKRFIAQTIYTGCSNLKVDRQLSREYFTSDAIYNGSAGMTLYYYMCRSWKDCCRRGENRSWPSVSVESVDSECWCLNDAIFYASILRLTVEECVFILERYLKNHVLRPLETKLLWKI
jgi:hypothetical protein